MSGEIVAKKSAGQAANDRVYLLRRLDERLRWISAWTIHNANHIRENRDGLKVGGHQASCASMTTIMAALYFDELRPTDRVSVKPHASPVFHAVQYLYGRQSRDQLQRFRAYGGAQSYPSRTKDRDDVDFSTGSVGLGVAVTAFASLAQDYLDARGWLAQGSRGRMISIMGDAELDEGNIYECLIEGHKHDARNVWWIVDYNRQSLDSTTTDSMFGKFEAIFLSFGWRVLTLKYGRLQREAFAEPGGETLRAWIDECTNVDYAALTFQGGAAWRERLLRDIGEDAATAALIGRRSDEDLHTLMTGLGGHCIETLLDAFAEAQDQNPTLFIAYTIKGFGLPLQGHKDNHAGLMTVAQMGELRTRLGIKEGEEWDEYAGLPEDDVRRLEGFISQSPFAAKRDKKIAERIAVPDAAAFPIPSGERQSTQSAFGKIIHALSRLEHPIAERLVTTSPDVTVSTNLGSFVNQRGLFRRTAHADAFRAAKIPSIQKWEYGDRGQHIELGIAENNLFLVLAALGMTAPLWGERLLPIGTVYDPFIARGLDALNYACYQDSRFMLVATPSGVTLAPEGGAHQSIVSPLVGLGQPGLTYIEPAFADELSLAMRWSFDHMQKDDGGSVYLRLSTRAIAQVSRDDDRWKIDAEKGGYWLRKPKPGARVAVAFCGVVAPEVLAAIDLLEQEMPDIGILNVVSPSLLYRDYLLSRNAAGSGVAHCEGLLSAMHERSALVTVIDGAPATLSWLGGVKGQRVTALGVNAFGQTGDIPDLYRHFGLDAAAIAEACRSAMV